MLIQQVKSMQCRIPWVRLVAAVVALTLLSLLSTPSTTAASTLTAHSATSTPSHLSPPVSRARTNFNNVINRHSTVNPQPAPSSSQHSTEEDEEEDMIEYAVNSERQLYKPTDEVQQPTTKTTTTAHSRQGNDAPTLSNPFMHSTRQIIKSLKTKAAFISKHFNSPASSNPQSRRELKSGTQTTPHSTDQHKSTEKRSIFKNSKLTRSINKIQPLEDTHQHPTEQQQQHSASPSTPSSSSPQPQQHQRSQRHSKPSQVKSTHELHQGNLSTEESRFHHIRHSFGDVSRQYVLLPQQYIDHRRLSRWRYNVKDWFWGSQNRRSQLKAQDFKAMADEIDRYIHRMEQTIREYESDSHHQQRSHTSDPSLSHWPTGFFNSNFKVKSNIQRDTTPTIPEEQEEDPQTHTQQPEIQTHLQQTQTAMQSLQQQQQHSTQVTDKQQRQYHHTHNHNQHPTLSAHPGPSESVGVRKRKNWLASLKQSIKPLQHIFQLTTATQRHEREMLKRFQQQQQTSQSH